MNTSRKGPAADRVADALAAGELWRAKEILRGRLRSREFDPGVCEQLGVVLLRMEDHFEAGKFLLLSGQRRPEYEHAIQIFLQRYSRSPWQNMLATFPRSARHCSWSELPSRTRQDLEAAGVPPRPDNERLSITMAPATTRKGSCLGVALLLLFCVLIGFGLAMVMVHFGFGV